jgi:hypothetical protein
MLLMLGNDNMKGVGDALKATKVAHAVVVSRGSGGIHASHNTPVSIPLCYKCVYKVSVLLAVLCWNSDSVLTR